MGGLPMVVEPVGTRSTHRYPSTHTISRSDLLPTSRGGHRELSIFDATGYRMLMLILSDSYGR